MADLRPHSSAAMYRPDFATQYAAAHGKKPLPSTPPTSSPHLHPQGTVMPGKIIPPSSTSVMSLFTPLMTNMPPPPIPMHHQQQVLANNASVSSIQGYAAESPYNPDYYHNDFEPHDMPYQEDPCYLPLGAKPLPAIPNAPCHPAYNPEFLDDTPPYGFVNPAHTLSPHRFPDSSEHNQTLHLPSAPPMPSSYDGEMSYHPLPDIHTNPYEHSSVPYPEYTQPPSDYYPSHYPEYESYDAHYPTH